MKDKYNRRIHYMRVSVTQRCNIRCQYCMPAQGVEKQTHDDMLSLEELYSVIEEAVDLGIDKIRLTGGEPLLRKGIDQLIRKVGKLKGVKDFTLTTNGILLEKFIPVLKQGGIHRLNISLDTLDADKYKEITRGGNIDKVLGGIAAAKAAGMGPIKLNTVLIGGWNDTEIPALAELVSKGLVDELRFIELMPIGETESWAKERFVSNEIVKDYLELTEIPTPESSPAQMFQMPDGGRIGLINPVSHKFCSSCNRIRLTADGKLKPCLLTDTEIDLRKTIRSGGDIRQDLVQVIGEKPKEHSLEKENGTPTGRNMGHIGG